MYLIISIILLICTYTISKIQPKYRKILIISNSIVSLVYIMWRITTLSYYSVLSFILSVALLIAEIMGLMQFFTFQYLFMKKYQVEIKTLNDFGNNDMPNVDILICTYNEGVNLLEKTIAAAKNITYPVGKMKIYVCDDGRRNEVKALCKDYNVGYITRDSNEGAKAGNINNALTKTTGELFAVLDADMLPKKNFLERTIGYFIDENVAFVQTPQVYYNQDMYQYNLKRKVPNEQDFFMRDIQDARASINAVLHVGTNAIFRKRCVLEIGGYPTSSITEDMAVGMLLQEKKFRTIFINEVLVLGLSASTFTDLVQQRDRWCRGNIQVIREYNPLFRKGLTIGQKIAYFDGVLYWFSSIQKMIYVISPLIYLLFAIIIINTTMDKLILYYVPFILGQLLIFSAISPKTRNIKWAHFYEIAMAPHISFSVIKEIFMLKIKFNVTPKEQTYEKAHFQARIVMPHIVLAALTILSWIIGTIYLKENKIDLEAYLINIFWSAYNFIGIIIALRVAYQKPMFRVTERVKVNKNNKAEIYKDKSKIVKGTIKNISERGIGIYTDNPDYFKINDKVQIKFWDKDNELLLSAEVKRKHKSLLGLEFNRLSPTEMQNIISIYIDNLAPYYDVKRQQAYIYKDEKKS